MSISFLRSTYLLFVNLHVERFKGDISEQAGEVTLDLQRCDTRKKPHHLGVLPHETKILTIKSRFLLLADTGDEPGNIIELIDEIVLKSVLESDGEDGEVW